MGGDSASTEISGWKLSDEIWSSNTASNFITVIRMCATRGEFFRSQNITDGSVSLMLGAGTCSGYDPNLSLNQVFDNSSVKSVLTCVAVDGTASATNQIYTPTAWDGRVIRFNPAVASDIIVKNAATQLILRTLWKQQQPRCRVTCYSIMVRTMYPSQFLVRRVLLDHF